MRDKNIITRYFFIAYIYVINYLLRARRITDIIPQANIPRRQSATNTFRGRCAKKAALVPLYTKYNVKPYKAPYANAIYRGCPCVFGPTNTAVPITITTHTSTPIHKRVSQPRYGANHWR